MTHSIIGRRDPYTPLLNLGFSVFPLGGLSKVPKKDFRWSEYQTRKPTTEEILDWRFNRPFANVGVVTGKISDLVVVDLDGEKGIKEFERFLDKDIATPIVQTRKGFHLYYHYPEFPVRNFVRGGSERTFLDEIDLRGDGGYVVGVGSIHPDDWTFKYHWESHPDDGGLEELPEAFKDFLKAKIWDADNNSASTSTFVTVPNHQWGSDSRQVEIEDRTARDRLIAQQIDNVRNAREGTRNSTLNRSAFIIGKNVPMDASDQEDVATKLMLAASEIGLPSGEAGATIWSGLNSGAIVMRETQKLKGTNNGRRETEIRGRRSLTDVGNSARFAFRFKDTIRYNHNSEKWMLYDGSRWVEDYKDQVKEMVKESARMIWQDVPAEDDSHRKEIAKWARSSEFKKHLTATLDLAESIDQVCILQDQLDEDLNLINLRNGVYDLKTNQLIGHDPMFLLSKVANVVYDPDATAPVFMDFLNTIFNGDEALIRYVQQVLGYSCFGDTSEQLFFLSHGIGANGKSTLLNAVLHVMGDYGRQASFDSFTTKRGNQIRNDLASFCGLRLIVASEGEEGSRFAESLLKQLTGGEAMTVRFLFKEYFTYVPQFVIWMVTNHKPTVRGGDHAFWRRLRVIPFSVIIPEDRRDKRLPQKLRGESAGIFNWVVEGYRDWRESGFVVPRAVNEATEEYRMEMDLIGCFLDECTVIDPSGVVTSADLYSAYSHWCEGYGEQPFPSRLFGMRMKERGYQQKRGTGGVRKWAGLTLTLTPEQKLLLGKLL